MTGKPHRLKAFAIAVGLWALPPMGALVVAHLPITENTRETLILQMLLPLVLVASVPLQVVDVLGPHGLAEPASMYLPRWAVGALSCISLLLSIVMFYAGVLALLRWAERRRLAPGSGGR